MSPVTYDLSGHATVRDGAAFAGLTIRHVIQDAFHRFAIRQGALPYFAVRLLAPLTFVRVQKENQLLLNESTFLRVRRRFRRWAYKERFTDNPQISVIGKRGNSPEI